ncbi:MAG TPA: hypothetical protein VJT09_05175 [Pyrinomonadaceae bacterium]|nr:hypothetical protein [Pyrinomonadaceae bacterium]
MTKEEARQFKARWKLANDAVIEEMRRTPASVKLSQLALMYEAGQIFGWSSDLRGGEEEVRERWRLLREKLHA